MLSVHVYFWHLLAVSYFYLFRTILHKLRKTFCNKFVFCSRVLRVSNSEYRGHAAFCIIGLAAWKNWAVVSRSFDFVPILACTLERQMLHLACRFIVFPRAESEFAWACLPDLFFFLSRRGTLRLGRARSFSLQYIIV